MAFYDLPPEELERYAPQRDEPADFDSFWAQTLVDARTHPLDASFTPFDEGLALVESYDVRFNGYNGDPIRAWYTRPAGVSTPLPCVVEFHGYNGGRGYPHNWLIWSNAGYASLIMDTRAQGGNWRRGDTPDPSGGGASYVPGYMTQGILDPQTYFYRRVFTDAVRAVEAVKAREDVDGARIAVSGMSQGGGISLAAAALSDDVALCLPDVPFLCHFKRAVTLIDNFPYREILNYLRLHRADADRVWATLAYFDGVNMASRIKAECLFSVGLMDTVCPPSTVYAAYNHVNARKAIRVYPYNDHEGGGDDQTIEKIRFLRARWG